MKRVIRNSIFSLATLASAAGATGQCGYTLPGSGIYVPDAEDLNTIGIPPQPVEEEPRIINETLAADQSGFVSTRADALLISSSVFPSILRCGVSDWDETPGEHLYVLEDIRENAVYLRFSRLPEFAQYSITQIKLKLPIANSLQNNLYFRVDIAPLSEAFDEDELNGTNFPNSYITVRGGNDPDISSVFRTDKAQPGEIVEFDLTNLVFLRNGQEQRLIENLDGIYGFALIPRSFDDFNLIENYRTFTRQGTSAPKLTVQGRTQNSL